MSRALFSAIVHGVLSALLVACGEKGTFDPARAGEEEEEEREDEPAPIRHGNASGWMSRASISSPSDTRGP